VTLPLANWYSWRQGQRDMHIPVREGLRSSGLCTNPPNEGSCTAWSLEGATLLRTTVKRHIAGTVAVY
jgi:hypothetical protein